MNGRLIKHDFLFRRLVRCGQCGYRLVGERQKGRVYYRCHTRTCSATCVREDAVEEALLEAIAPLRFSSSERALMEELLKDQKQRWEDEAREYAGGLQLQLKKVGSRLNALTDALIEGLIDRETFNQRKEALLTEQGRLRDQIGTTERSGIPCRLTEILELAEAASVLYGEAKAPERRDLAETLISNLTLISGNVDVVLAPPFSIIAKRFQLPTGGACRGDPRTLQILFDSLTVFVKGIKEEVAEQIGALAKTMQSRIPRG